MADIKITDLVDPSAIQQIKDLNAELKTLLDTYTNVAKDLARGLQIEIKSVGDIDKMENLGIYEVVEEDFALCEFVDPSKIEMQQIIRDGINLMIKEA